VRVRGEYLGEYREGTGMEGTGKVQGRYREGTGKVQLTVTVCACAESTAESMRALPAPPSALLLAAADESRAWSSRSRRSELMWPYEKGARRR
jgi:hypothetical protein